MSDRDYRNSGVLFVNKKRGDNAKAPNLKGDGRITIDGRDYELDLAAWTRQSDRAGKFLSLSIKPKGDTARGDRRSNHSEQPAPSDFAAAPSDFLQECQALGMRESFVAAMVRKRFRKSPQELTSAELEEFLATYRGADSPDAEPRHEDKDLPW
jgi:hypothetical protein